MLIVISVPIQNNGYDCGIFVCRYAFNIVNLVHQTLNMRDICSNGLSDYITNNDLFQFDQNDISKFRGELYDIVTELTKLYCEHRVVEDRPVIESDDDSMEITTKRNSTRRRRNDEGNYKRDESSVRKRRKTSTRPNYSYQRNIGDYSDDDMSIESNDELSDDDYSNGSWSDGGDEDLYADSTCEC